MCSFGRCRIQFLSLLTSFTHNYRVICKLPLHLLITCNYKLSLKVQLHWSEFFSLSTVIFLVTSLRTRGLRKSIPWIIRLRQLIQILPPLAANGRPWVLFPSLSFAIYKIQPFDSRLCFSLQHDNTNSSLFEKMHISLVSSDNLLTIFGLHDPLNVC